ncbi:hypothetical protein M5K25_015384 [Dendrobium thyrsiflorum]|uniref:Uncharacterized protein n=1 Tax=Dendrobium thyrsiflorum TaxID=117978 RepID=A0ABD0UQ47_DENTH
MGIRALQSRVPMAGRKMEVLEGEIGQLKSDFVKKISNFENQFVSVHEKMDGKFAIVEEMPKKLLEVKLKMTTSETKDVNGGQGSGGNPNPFRGGEN